MCGIAGILTLKRDEGLQPALKAMTDSIQHRGPDGEGFWINPDGCTAFGHRRLAVIDLSAAGKQPMHYLDRYTITYNGEIYNYIELKELCLKNGYRFHTGTDTEVVMAMYDWKKESCLSYFDGMFSFALHDEKEKKVFIARDRFGEKPFFYTMTRETIRFASEMKALWAAGTPRNINNRMLYNYLAFRYTENPSDRSETFYTGICRLPHAHYMSVDMTSLQVTVKKYWDVNPEQTDRSIDINQAREKFMNLFRTSVSRRLRSDVAAGTSLSGGLDSSAVVAMIDELNTGKKIKQHTFSAVFPGYEKDESRFIQILLKDRNVEPHFTSPGKEALRQHLETCFYHQEEPFGSASVLAQFEVFRLARENQVTVLLDGQGADELLAGYHHFFPLYFQELKNHNREAFRAEQSAYQARYAGSQINPLPEKNLKYYAKKWSRLPPDKLRKKYSAYRQLVNPYFNKDFFQVYSREQFVFHEQPATLNQALYNSLHDELTGLLRFADRNSMASGREARFPFLFHELVEFFFTLPALFKIRDGWTKYLERLTFEHMLPPEITWRTDKVGYEPPQKDWMDDELIKEMIADTRQQMVKDRILHPQVINRKIEPVAAHEDKHFAWNHLMVYFLMNKTGS